LFKLKCLKGGQRLQTKVRVRARRRERGLRFRAAERDGAGRKGKGGGRGVWVCEAYEAKNTREKLRCLSLRRIFICNFFRAAAQSARHWVRTAAHQRCWSAERSCSFGRQSVAAESNPPPVLFLPARARCRPTSRHRWILFFVEFFQISNSAIRLLNPALF
jgi:hypothetical protein